MLCAAVLVCELICEPVASTTCTTGKLVLAVIGVVGTMGGELSSSKELELLSGISRSKVSPPPLSGGLAPWPATIC